MDNEGKFEMVTHSQSQFVTLTDKIYREGSRWIEICYPWLTTQGNGVPAV